MHNQDKLLNTYWFILGINIQNHGAKRVDYNFSNKYFNIRLTQQRVPYLKTATYFRVNRLSSAHQQNA